MGKFQFTPKLVAEQLLPCKNW